MASLAELKTALRNAEARGATEDATLLANAIQERTPTPPRDRAAEQAAIYRRLAELAPVTLGQTIQEVPKGVGSGIAGILESAALGAATLLPEEQELAARRGIQAVGGGVQDFLAPDLNIQARIAEGENNLGTIPRKFSEALGSFAGILGTAAIPVVGIPAAGALAVGAGAGEASERAREAGATEEERTRAAQLGSIVGASELISPLRIAKIFKKGLGEKTATDIISRAKRVGAEAGLEGLQEFGASVGQNLIEQGIYNPEQGTFVGSGEALGYGAGVGGFVRAIVELVTPRTRGRDTPPPTEETDPQRELFGPDVDLGTAPRPQPTQGELFGRETDLGTAPSPRATERTTKDSRQQEMDLGPEQLDLFADRRKEQETKAKEVDLARTAATADTAMGEQISRQLAERQKQEQQFKEAETALDAKKVEDKFAVAPDKPVEQIQLSLPGLKPTYGEKRRQARIDEREVKTKPTATGVQLTEELVSTMAGRDPNVVTSGLLDRLGVSSKAPMRKRVEGKDINTPEVRQQFIDFGNNPKVAQQTRLNISRYLADVAEGQGDLFAPQKRGKPDARADTTRSGVGVSSDRQDAPKTDAVQVGSAKKVDAPAAAGLGRLDPTTDAVDAREGPEAGALTYDELSIKQKRELAAAPENEKGKVLASFVKKPEASTLEFKELPREQGRAFRRSLAARFKLRKEKDQTELRNPKTDTGVLIDTSLANPFVPLKEYYDALSKEQKDIYNATPENKKGKVLAELSIAPEPEVTAPQKLTKTAAAIKEYVDRKDKTNEDAIVLFQEVAAINNVDIGEAKKLVQTALKGSKKLKLPVDETLNLPVDDSVVAAAKKGNLKEALEAVANTTANTELSNFVTMLSKNVGNTTIEVRKNLKDDDGQLVSGYFDPKTNSIVLDETNGMSQHTILHEMLHAVTSTPLANKSHPLTKKLNGIFEGVKEQLSGEYGLTSLDDFVAEYRTNPKFRNQLKITTVNGRTPWQQLTRAIANFIRTLFNRPTVSETSTFDAVDKLVQDLISPNYDERVATKLYMKIKTPAGAKEALNNAAASTVNYVKGKGGYDYIQDSRNFIGSKIPLPVKKLWLNLQPVNILSELSESRIPGATQLNTLVNNMSSTLRKKNESLDPIVADIKSFRKEKPELYTILQSLVPNATYERIDPRKADFNKAYGYSKKSERYDPETAKEIHKKLREDYKKLGKEGQDLYNVITNTFEKSLLDVMDAVEANLSATITGAAGQKRARDRLAELLEQERGTIRPFAPLTRAGRHRLKYTAIDPKTGKIEVFVEYFKTKGQREKAKRNLQEYNKSSLAKLPPNDPRRSEVSNALMEEGTNTDVINYNNAPRGSFVFNVLEILRAEGADETTINSVIDLALDSMPERSFMQSFRTRKDIRGFLGDATPTGMAAEAFDLVDMVETKGRDYNRQLVQMEFGAKIQKFQQEVLEAPFSRETTDETTTLYRDRLNLIANFAKKPDIPRWSQSINAAGYAWTMGWNFSSAAITTFDVFMSSAPRMAGRYGDGATAKAMGSAAAILFRSPKTKMVEVMGPDGNMTGRKINTGLAGFSIGNYDYEMLKNMTPQEITNAGMTKKQHKNLLDLEVMAEVAKENAQINQSLNQEELDMNNAKDTLEKINSTTSFLFHHSERYNRETAMTANYLLELNRLRSDKATSTEKKLTDLEKQQRAAATAIKETEFTLGATASAGRPVFAQNPIGNVAMLFKRFAISKYHMMATMTNEAFQAGGDSQAQENRRIAQHQLGRFLISTGLFAGVAGLPLMGALGQIYDLFADDDEDDFDAMLRKNVGEEFYKGIINEALGIELSSRISMNSLLYRPPIINKDQSRFFTLIEQLGGPAVGIGLSIERGIGLWGEGEIVKGVEAVAPATVRNVVKGIKQAATGEITTRRGDAVVEDIGLFQTIAQFSGFANADLIKQYDINKNERRKSGYVSEQRTSLLQEANIAITNGDFKGYANVLKKIREYNMNLPPAARKEKLILPKTMDRSRKSFEARTAKTIGGIKYDAMMIESLNEYDQGMRLFS